MSSSIIVYAIAASIRDRWNTVYVSRAVSRASSIIVYAIAASIRDRWRTGYVNRASSIIVYATAASIRDRWRTAATLIVPVALLSTPLPQVSETGAVVVGVQPSLLVEAIVPSVLLSAPMSHVSDAGGEVVVFVFVLASVVLVYYLH